MTIDDELYKNLLEHAKRKLVEYRKNIMAIKTLCYNYKEVY